jgi:uncharacterized membrane protein
MLFSYMLLGIVAVFQIIHYYPRLPDKVASHFNAAFRPDGWMSKRGFILVYAAIAGTMVLAGLVLHVMALPRQPVIIVLATFGLVVAIFELAFLYNTDRLRRFLPWIMWGFIGLYTCLCVGLAMPH